MWFNNNLKSLNRKRFKFEWLEEKWTEHERYAKKNHAVSRNSSSKRYGGISVQGPRVAVDNNKRDRSSRPPTVSINGGSYRSSFLRSRTTGPKRRSERVGCPGYLNPPLSRSPFHPFLLNGGRMNQCQTHARCGLFSLFLLTVLLHYPSVSRGPPTRVCSRCILWQPRETRSRALRRTEKNKREKGLRHLPTALKNQIVFRTK